MNTKTKVTIGVTFLFLLIIVMGVTSIYFIRSLSGDTDRLIKDNQQSIDYVEHMNRDMAKLQFFATYGSHSGIDIKDRETSDVFSDFSKNLDSESHNITEIGEEKAVLNLRSAFNDYKTGFYLVAKGNSLDIISGSYINLETNLNTIYELNKQAILEKNSFESKTASKGVYYVTLVGSVFILVAFVFVLSFPSKIAG